MLFSHARRLHTLHFVHSMHLRDTPSQHTSLTGQLSSANPGSGLRAPSSKHQLEKCSTAGDCRLPVLYPRLGVRFLQCIGKGLLRTVPEMPDVPELDPLASSSNPSNPRKERSVVCTWSERETTLPRGTEHVGKMHDWL